MQSLAAMLDAGEQQITDLKQEQRHKYDALTKEASTPHCLHSMTRHITATSLPAGSPKPLQHDMLPRTRQLTYKFGEVTE